MPAGRVPLTQLCLPRRYMKHKRDDGPEKQEDEAVDVTPVMICVFVVMCCSMLVLLYYFYDQLGAPPAHQRDAEARTPAHRSRVPPPPACGVPLEKSVVGRTRAAIASPEEGTSARGTVPLVISCRPPS